jgi:hypothetical protein
MLARWWHSADYGLLYAVGGWGGSVVARFAHGKLPPEGSKMAEQKPDDSEELGHEPLAVSARGVSIAAAMLLGVVVAALLLIAGLVMLLAGWRGGSATVHSPGTPVAPPPGIPAVDANQIGTLRQLRAREQALLTGYEWIDREEGVARIPIRRAMEILAKQPAPAPETPDEDMAAR